MPVRSRGATLRTGYERIRDLLWPPKAERSRVYAILDGARDRRIFGAVDAARLERTCLFSMNLRWPGEELPWKLIGDAPYLVELEPDADLTKFLIVHGWHDHWGVFFHSDGSLKQVRKHFRDLLVVQDHLGRFLMFRYYDPRVLRQYLPSCRTEELRTFFGPVTDLIVPGATHHTAIRYHFDGIALQHLTFEFHDAPEGMPPRAPAANRAPAVLHSTRRKISFVVTARDEAQNLLETTIDGIRNTAGDREFEILLVDDASVVPVTLERPGLTVSRNDSPRGVAQSRRAGASLADADILAFTDAHMQFAPDWLERMLEHVDSGAFLCAAWWDYEMRRAVCWGGEYVWSDQRDYHAGRTPGFAFKHLTRFPGDGAVEVPMAVGACYVVKRQSYERMGGFSPHFRIWGRCEQDISARAWITGVGVKCVTGAHVGHFSRKKFPYAVKWSDIEFNQVAMVRTAFEESTARLIESLMGPLSAEVQAWLGHVDWKSWRSVVQSQRRMSDAEFFRRFVRNAPAQVLDHLVSSRG